MTESRTIYCRLSNAPLYPNFVSDIITESNINVNPIPALIVSSSYPSITENITPKIASMESTIDATVARIYFNPIVCR